MSTSRVIKERSILSFSLFFLSLSLSRKERNERKINFFSQSSFSLSLCLPSMEGMTGRPILSFISLYLHILSFFLSAKTETERNLNVNERNERKVNFSIIFLFLCISFVSLSLSLCKLRARKEWSEIYASI